MAKRLPPLKPLRAFETAARHLSFTLAAEELYLTQAAISHQIKALEESLGVPLFKRLNRALILTEEGHIFLHATRQALDILATAAEKIARQEATGPLYVSVLPSFAATWLVPRLPRFRQRYPDVDIRLTANDDMSDFDYDEIDLAIRWGRGDYPGLQIVEFMTEDIFPVCSPKLLRDDPHPLRTPDDLRYHTLLHDDIELNWGAWLKAAGIQGVNPHRGPSFNHSDLALRAAIDGQGVALGRSALVHDALISGLLVKPFALSLASPDAYYVVCPDYAFNRPKIKAFREWLQEEAARDLRERHENLAKG